LKSSFRDDTRMVFMLFGGRFKKGCWNGFQCGLGVILRWFRVILECAGILGCTKNCVGKVSRQSFKMLWDGCKSGEWAAEY
jgi:hypothetical protein